ncbi:hypothetical protein Q7C30_004330 [Pseudomonas sp. RAC1]|uniref:hypothetical protein n=1 Tax=Pseudomonas sp. RAC1 TaxID=3064900 RepID=UPI002725CA61|nr:hypothetical protein [Pseudomonas sp. RAC1]MDV9031333.1 hypothetical protein [Pseudomonas sp. RAC1]
MSEVRLLLHIDFLRDDAVRESLAINIATTGCLPSDDALAEIMQKEVMTHLSKHPWVTQQ